jgi:hypothetical protein
MLEKETGSCRNVYGHAAGGALSGFPKPVPRDNYEVFKWLVFTKGQRSNGVGPSQLPSRASPPHGVEGSHAVRDARQHRVWRKLIQQYYREGRNQGKSVNDALRYAGTKYNGSSAYGDSFLTEALKWKARVGSADFP